MENESIHSDIHTYLELIEIAIQMADDCSDQQGRECQAWIQECERLRDCPCGDMHMDLGKPLKINPRSIYRGEE